MTVRILLGDCLQKLQLLEDNSVDAIVTDPPYGLSFMGKKWDYDVPSVAIWEQCLRVLKPGGHILAFAGTRTQHRMAVRIEDAGFEIRDMIAWVYGSGFPKSLDVSKAIDKAAGAEREVTGTHSGCGIKSGEGSKRLNATANYTSTAFTGERRDNPATEAAKQWQGWGTALKPSLEPITVARKPLCGTVAENVLQHGTGGLNVDGCRVGTEPPAPRNAPRKDIRGGKFHSGAEAEMVMGHYNPTQGRWPANLIHDGSDEVTGLFPQGSFNKPVMWQSDGDGVDGTRALGRGVGKRTAGTVRYAYGDTGSAARFFYCAKASKRDRGEGNNHPTVKPTALMRYLCRLVTPPNGTVLDPFMGSGSTGVAATLEKLNFIGIELLREHFETSKRRIIEAKGTK